MFLTCHYIGLAAKIFVVDLDVLALELRAQRLSAACFCRRVSDGLFSISLEWHLLTWVSTTPSTDERGTLGLTGGHTCVVYTEHQSARGETLLQFRCSWAGARMSLYAYLSLSLWSCVPYPILSFLVLVPLVSSWERTHGRQNFMTLHLCLPWHLMDSLDKVL